MTDRNRTTVIAGRSFNLIIAADDPHDWRLADPADQPAFDAAWAQMEDDLRGRKAA